MATLDIAFTNKSTTDTVFVYVTGLQIDNNNQWYLLQADGKTIYNLVSPASPGAALTEDVAIPIGPIGSTKTVTIPHTAGGRFYFSYDTKLTFASNPGPSLVEPSVTNPSDPNINILWGFAEFTWNDAQIYANISYVDFVSIPVGLQLTNNSGATTNVGGMPANGLETIADALTQQSDRDGQGWKNLIYSNSDGRLVRILSPNQGMVMDGNLLQGYYDPYVASVWSRYSNGNNLTVNINTPATGTVTSDGQLTFNNDSSLKFAKPTTRDIFSSNNGPFTTGGNQTLNTIIPVLAAEFNRSTLLASSTLPASSNLDYQESVTNHYGRIVHSVNADGKGYTQPYDDVTPAGGPDASGFVNDPNPKLLNIILGGT